MSIVQQAQQLYDPGVPFEIPIPEGSLFSLLSEAAVKYPKVTAIDFFGATTTYEDVLIQAEKAAQLLLDAGVRKGDAVAVVLPNCPQAFVVFYACLRIGAVAAQHNPLAPKPELRQQFHRHRAKVAVVWEKSLPGCPLEEPTELETVFAVDLSAGLPFPQRMALKLPVPAARSKRQELRGPVPHEVRSWDKSVSASPRIDPLHPHAEAEDRAVILHTGGTNGVPKSVPLTHQNLGANTNQCTFWVFKLHEGAETFYSLLPYFHAFGLTFFLCAAVKLAATQVVLPKFDAAMSIEAHRRRNVTFFVGVPAMFERIALEAQKTGTDISSIKYAVSGAMSLSEKIADLWQSTTGGVIIEGYGLSETSPVISGSPMAPNRRLGTLGMPFPSTQVRLVQLDDCTKDVPDGEPGEIIVKGPQVFEGYLDDPQETAQVFTPEGWFRTGDIAVNEDGYLFLVDRQKDLILSGGFNVYPSQVEEVLKMMPGVKDVAVVGMPVDDSREEVTAALVVEEEKTRFTIEQVRQWTETYLPHYALPRRIVFLTEIPRNPIGKVMRRTVREQLIAPASRMWAEAAKTLTGVVEQAADILSSGQVDVKPVPDSAAEKQNVTTEEGRAPSPTNDVS